MNNIRKAIVAAFMACAYVATANAQIEGSALNYMLQRPRVAKKWKQKTYFDHLFVDAGLGTNIMGTRHPEFGLTADFNIGDWFTPEHGARININGGKWSTRGLKAKYLDLSLDYLLNITAIAQPGTYYETKRFEVYGIAGFDLATSHCKNVTKYGMGIHVGLRGQYALSDNFYTYLESRYGLMEDQISQQETWHGYRPFTTLTMGLGYRLPFVRKNYEDPERGKHSIWDGIFVGGMVGPATLSNAHKTTWGDFLGVRQAASAGKWFGPYHGARFTLSSTTIRPDNQWRTKALSSQFEYLLNLNNLIGGVDPERYVWINALAGFSFNRSSDRIDGIKSSWGFSGGLQGNIRLSRGLAFVIEPRVDSYTKNFMQQDRVFKKWSMMPSLLAGFMYTYHDRYAIERREAGIHGIPKASISIAGGLASTSTKMKQTDYWMPVARISYTKWSAASHGVRFSLDGTMQRRIEDKRYSKAVGAFDWLADLTAMNYGTENTKWLSIRSVIGFAVGADYGGHKSYFSADVHAGVQGRIRLSSTTGLFIEPQMAYELSDRFMHRNWGRVTPRTLVGLDYTMNRDKGSSDLKEAPEEKNFITIGGGAGLFSGSFSELHAQHKLTYNVQAGYGHWFNGVHGVHGSVSETFAKRGANGLSYTDHITAVTADYMMNMRNAITGEQSDDRLFQVTGMLGAQLSVNSCDMHKTKVVPGVHAAIQAGFRLSRHFEIYAEPAAVVHAKSIDQVKDQEPANGELKFSIGTKFHF